MFDYSCQVCAERTLIFPSQITSVTNTANGIEVAFTCWCGTEQTSLTGKARRPRLDPVAA